MSESTTTSNSATRKHGRHLRVPVLPEEEAAIKAQANAADLSIAEYLRRVALGHEVRSTIDQRHVGELAKINADQGRLGGLLKLWLTNDEKLRCYDAEQLRQTILGVLDQIQATQRSMLEAVQRL